MDKKNKNSERKAKTRPFTERLLFADKSQKKTPEELPDRVDLSMATTETKIFLSII